MPRRRCEGDGVGGKIELKQRARTLSPTFGGAIIQNFNFVKNHEFKFSLWYSYVVSLVLQFDMG